MDKKLKKKLFNFSFWIFNIIVISLFIGMMSYLFLNTKNIGGLNYSEVSDKLHINNIIPISTTVFFTGFGANIYLFNGKIKKIIKNIGADVVDFIFKTFLLLEFPIFITSTILASKESNPKVSVIGWSLFISVYFIFYFFSFVANISEDGRYKKAKPLVYKLGIYDYDAIRESFVKNIPRTIVENGYFKRKSYSVHYYVAHRNYDYVYAFIYLKSLNENMVSSYYNEGLFSFVQHLYDEKYLKDRRNARLIYVFVVDKINDKFMKLANASVVYQEDFNMLHVLISLDTQDVYVGGCNSKNKTELANYNVLKNEALECLKEIIDDRYIDSN